MIQSENLNIVSPLRSSASSLSSKIYQDQILVDSEQHDFSTLPYPHCSDLVAFPVAFDFSPQPFSTPKVDGKEYVNEHELDFLPPGTKSFPTPTRLMETESQLGCDCVACFLSSVASAYIYQSNPICKFSSCRKSYYEIIGTTSNYNDLKGQSAFRNHFLQHYHQSGQYICQIESCKSTFQRPNDMVRHYRSQHCTRREKYPCNVIGCKYTGDNGFARKDKLRSHYKNVHEGQALPGRSLRTILPARHG